MIMTEEVPCPAGLHLKFSGVGHVCRYRRDCAKTGKSFERKTKRHMTATGNAARKHAARIDTDFGDELVDHPRHESHVVDVELVRAVLTDNVTRVPIALVPIGIDDRKAAFVGKAFESIHRCDSHFRTVFARAGHHHHNRGSFRQPLRHVGQVSPL